MPNRPVQIIIAIAALGLLGYGAWSQFGPSGTSPDRVASNGSGEPAAPTEPTPQPLADNLGTKNVDLEAARAAKAQQDLTAAAQNGAIIAQSQGLAQGVAQGEAIAKESKVPVLMPSGLVLPASNEPPSVKATKDGYFARFRTAKYDLVVNGSAAFVKDPNAPKKVETASNAENYKFEQVDGGATLAFSRFGADYFMEFECREGGEEASCVTEAEAIDIAKKLRIAGQP